MSNNLGFFKVYLPPPKGPERLPIPSAFVKHVKGAIPDKAFLRNCHGKLWPVVVTKVGNQLCFKDGWVKFVEDNSVEVGNFLVFDFDGNYVFDFKLFGRTECEIKMIGSSGFKVKEEKEEEEEEEEKVKEEEEEEEDELEANTLRKKTEKEKSGKSTKSLKKIKQGTNYGNKGKVTIEDKGGNKRAYRMEVEDEEGDELEAKTLRKKTEKGKSEKSTKGLKKINQGTNCWFNLDGNKGKAAIKDKCGNKRAYRMEVEDEEEETDDDDEEEDELEATTLRKKTEKGKSEKSTKGLKKINQGTCYGNKRKATIKDKGGNKRAYTMEVEEEEEQTDDDDEEEDELEAKALRKKTENGKRGKSTKGLKKINQGTSYGNKGKATSKDKGGNKRAYTMEVEDEEEETDDDDDDDDDEEDELEAKILRKKTEKEKSEKFANGLEKISQGTSYGNNGKAAIKDKGGNKRADTIGVENDDDVFKYGMVSWPKNPCFVAKLRSTRRSELYVPMDVIRDHNLKLPSNLILLDEEGRKWSTKVVQWNDGRTWLTVGWKAFCKWNNLKWEDRCICEFIRGKGRRGIFIKTSILRAGSWLPKEDSILSSDHRDQVDKRYFQGSPK